LLIFQEVFYFIPKYQLLNRNKLIKSYSSVKHFFFSLLWGREEINLMYSYIMIFLTAKFPGPIVFSFYWIGIIPILMAKKLVLNKYHDNF